MRTRNQDGFVSLPVLTVFTLIAVILVTIQTMRTTYMAREVHRDAFKMQARWLAESAVAIAVEDLTSGSDSFEMQKQFSRELAPIYIGEDPFEIRSEEFEDTRIKLVHYGYEIKPMKREHLPNVVNQAEEAYQIHGMARMSHRGYEIVREIRKLCWKSEENQWKTIPMVD